MHSSLNDTRALIHARKDDFIAKWVSRGSLTLSRVQGRVLVTD